MVDYHLDNYDGVKAYEELISLKDDKTSNDIGLNWRLAYACYILSNCSKEEEQRRAHLEEGKYYIDYANCSSSNQKVDINNLFLGHEYIVKAYSQAPDDPKVLHWAPIVTGSLAEVASGIRERIKYGHEFKKYIDEAITKLPPNFAFYHMRGRFRYEVASLSLVERGIAAVFFGSPPTATYEEALEDLLKAEEMEPGQIDNMLFIGKAYYALGNMPKSRKFLSKVASMNGIDAIDEEEIAEATSLLNKLPSPLPDEVDSEESDEETEFVSDEIEESDFDTAEHIQSSDEEGKD